MAILALTMGPHLGIIMVPTVLSVGSAGTITFKAVGANGNVRWKLVSSNLPAEWDTALNVSGGQATLETDEIEVPGTFTVTVQCTDEARTPVVRTFVVRTMALPLTISGSFPEWSTDLPATGALTISGGVLPYSGLSITSGALPSGVSLSIVGNQIVASGTPTVAGPWAATLRVEDSAESKAEIALSGEVEAMRLWTPADLPVAPKIWLDWDSSVTDVSGVASAWVNKGSMGGSFSQSNAGIRPEILYSGLNGKRIIRFDGTQDFMDHPGVSFANNTGEVWSFAVVKKRGISAAALQAVFNVHANYGGPTLYGTRYWLGCNIGSDANTPNMILRRLDSQAAGAVITADNSMGGDWRIICGRANYAGNHGEIFTDGLSAGSGAISTAGNTSPTDSFLPLRLGAGYASGSVPAYFSDIDVAVLIADSSTTLSSADRQRIEGWAAWQCGLQASLPVGHPYSDYPPMVPA